MAIIIGESGAWKDIKASLERWDLHANIPSELQPLLEKITKEYQPLVEKKKLEIAKRIVAIDDRIDYLKAEKNIFRKIFNLVEIMKLNKAIIFHNVDERKYIHFLDGRITALKKIIGIPEVAGAEAELDVIRVLTSLTDDYFIINDVYLHADRYIYFNGKYLLSAQIDHIILSPFGIFVVETKRWSKEFVATGDYHDPVEQIKRSSYLCYDVLRQRFGKIHVRGIIAFEGSLPAMGEGEYIKVIRVNDLLGYVSFFKRRELDSTMVSMIKEYLCLHVR